MRMSMSIEAVETVRPPSGEGGYGENRGYFSNAGCHWRGL